MRQIVIPVTNLHPGEIRLISISAKMRGDVVLFERKLWRGEIQLRNRPIEYCEKDIRYTVTSRALSQA